MHKPWSTKADDARYVIYGYDSGKQLTPSACIWMVPGTYVE
jgi:hypothetical protein